MTRESRGSGGIVLLSGPMPGAATHATTTPILNLGAPERIMVVCDFDYGSNGGTGQFWVQSSIDGETWWDLMCFAVATSDFKRAAPYTNSYTFIDSLLFLPDGTTSDNSIVTQGLLCNMLRLKYTINLASPYQNTTIKITAYAS